MNSHEDGVASRERCHGPGGQHGQGRRARGGPGGVLIALTLVLAVFSAGAPGQDLYDESKLRTLSLRFADANWFSTLAGNYPKATYVRADLTVDSVTYKDVGVRFRGNTSYRAATKKKPFKISMDAFVPGQRLYGYRTLNLNNGAFDPSHVREVLTYRIFRQYCAAPKANFVKLTVNGQNWGVYINVQQINKDLGRQWMLDEDGSRYRSEPGSIQNRSHGALIWLGTSPGPYQLGYELKSEGMANPWIDLIDLCRVLNNTPQAGLEAALPSVLSVDSAIWMLALNNAVVNPDNYLNYVSHNFYLYADDYHRRFRLLTWDVNHAFSSKVASLYNYDPDTQRTNPNRPLVSRMLAVPRWHEQYLTCIRNVLDDWISWAKLGPIIQQYQTLIDAEMKLEPHPIYPYSWFTTIVTKDVGGFTGLKPFIERRRAWLLTKGRMTKERPVVQRLTQTPARPTSREDTWITARVTATGAIGHVSLNYRTQGPFLRTPMFDDGAHRDGAKGDGVYGGRIPPQPAASTVDYYLEAQLTTGAGSGLQVDPRAPEVSAYRFAVQAVPGASLTVHEFLAINANGIRDEKGQREDWIELVNETAHAVTASGLYLTDDPLEPTKWRIPGGHVLAPGDRLLVWADNDPLDGPLHANFKLSGTNGEWILLYASDGKTLLDGIQFGPQAADVSTGRHPMWPRIQVTFPWPTPREPNQPRPGDWMPYRARSSGTNPAHLSMWMPTPPAWTGAFIIDSPIAHAPGVVAVTTEPHHLPTPLGTLLVAPGNWILLPFNTDDQGNSIAFVPVPKIGIPLSVHAQALVIGSRQTSLSGGVHFRLP